MPNASAYELDECVYVIFLRNLRLIIQVRYHLAQVRPRTFDVARLNPEAIKAVWAGMSFELLYGTNDDDER